MYVPSETPNEIKDLELGTEILLLGDWADKCFMYGKLAQKRFLTKQINDATKIKRVK